MKRKGNNKRQDGSKPLNDRANIVKKIFGRFREAVRERIKEDMGVMILRTLPYVLFFYFVEKGSWLYRHCRGNTAVEKAITMLMNFQYAFRSPLPSLHPADMAAGFAGAAALYAFLLYRKKNAKKFRQGEEYGSARWGTPKDIAPFIDPVFENNILLTKTERLTMSSRPKNPKYARNKNVIVIGGSGSGKTRGYVKPNLMQCESSAYPVSFVVTDPKVEVFKVKVESTVIAITKAVSKSMCSQLYFFVERWNMLERRKVAL